MSDHFPTKLDVEHAVAEFRLIAETLRRSCDAVAQRLAEHQQAIMALVEQHRLANMPVEEETPRDDWRLWRGGFCPVKNDCRVDVRQKDGHETSNVKASEVQWRHFKDANYITHWRYHEA